MGLLDQWLYRIPRAGGAKGSFRGLGLDLTQKQYRRGLFAPVHAVSQLWQSPEMQSYLNLSQSVIPQVAERIFGGARTMTAEAGEAAAAQGLGRGFAAQSATQARRGATGALSQAATAAQMSDIINQAEMARLFTNTLQQAQQGAWMKRQSHRQRMAERNDMLTGAGVQFGSSILGALLPMILGPAAGVTAGALDMNGKPGLMGDQQSPGYSQLMQLLQGLFANQGGR